MYKWCAKNNWKSFAQFETWGKEDRLGSLTAITVKKLENYFTQVIMKNIRDMEAIKRGIYATLRHCAN